MILFSIVTVVKNNIKGLEKTILSVRNQTHSSIEFIVIDGASTDGTIDLIKSNLDIIKIWRSELDDGLYHAMNKGKNLASGDFVIFINSGDVFYDNNVLSKFNEYIFNKDQIYYGNTLIYFKHTEVEYRPKKENPEINYLPHHQAIFYPSIFYNNEDYDLNFKLCGDIDYTSRAIKKYQAKYIPLFTIRSEFGGFGTLLVSTISGLKMHIRDHCDFVIKYKNQYLFIYILLIYVKAIMKYVAFKIGGLSLLAKLTSPPK